MKKEQDEYLAKHKAAGISLIDSSEKQKKGREIAEDFGLQAGPSGKDGGCDGTLFVGGEMICYFQCKISTEPLSSEAANTFFSYLFLYEPKIAIFVASSSYKHTFQKRLEQLKKKQESKKIPFPEVYLFDLYEVLSGGDKFKKAVSHLKSYGPSEIVDWARVFGEEG